MFRVLRIVFCILACLSVAAIIPVGVIWDFSFSLIPVGCALLFALLMFWVKDGNPFDKPKEEPHTDFMNSEEENEKIRKEMQKK